MVVQIFNIFIIPLPTMEENRCIMKLAKQMIPNLIIRKVKYNSINKDKRSFINS